MDNWLQDLFAWLPEGGLYFFILFAIALAESLVGVGIIVPGSVLIVFAGFLAAHGKGDIFAIAFYSGAGAIVGDSISYFLGARLGYRLRRTRPLLKYRSLLRKAESFFAAHGGKSIFFGRFIGPIRGFIPFVAGSARMRPWNFVAYVLVSGMLWGIVYPGMGYLGGASWQKVRLWSGRLGLLIGALLLLFILNGLFWKKAAPRLAVWGAALWQKALNAWGRFLHLPSVASWIERHPRTWIFLADRFSLRSGSGLYLTVGLAVSGLFALLFVWAIEYPLLWRLDKFFQAALQEIRVPAADRLMLAIGSLSDGLPLLLLAGLVLLWLVLENRDFSAVILLAGLGGGEILIMILQTFFHSPIPDPGMGNGIPGDHLFSFFLLCALVTYFLLKHFSAWQSRMTLIVSGSFVALLVGFSQIYLGTHRLSEVLSNLALAALWLTFLVTASEIRRRYAGEFPWRTGWQPLRISPLTRRITLVLALILLGGLLTRYLLERLSAS